MRKLLVATLSVLGVGFFTATPDQAQSQIVTWTVSGQKSGSSVTTEETFSIVKGVPQPPVTKTTKTSYTNFYPPTTFSSPIGNRNLSGFPQFNSSLPPIPQIQNIRNFGGSQLNKNYLGR
jgi:hypothetical protein